MEDARLRWGWGDHKPDPKYCHRCKEDIGWEWDKFHLTWDTWAVWTNSAWFRGEVFCSYYCLTESHLEQLEEFKNIR